MPGGSDDYRLTVNSTLCPVCQCQCRSDFASNTDSNKKPGINSYRLLSNLHCHASICQNNSAYRKQDNWTRDRANERRAHQLTANLTVSTGFQSKFLDFRGQNHIYLYKTKSGPQRRHDTKRHDTSVRPARWWQVMEATDNFKESNGDVATKKDTFLVYGQKKYTFQRLGRTALLLESRINRPGPRTSLASRHHVRSSHIP